MRQPPGIALIDKTAAISLVTALQKYQANIWPWLAKANLPIYLESSSAQFVPLKPFSHLLSQAFEHFTAADFINIVRVATSQYLAHAHLKLRPLPAHHPIADLVNLMPFSQVQLLIERQPGRSEPEQSWSLHFQLPELDESDFALEMYALSLVQGFLYQINKGHNCHNEPTKYHLQSTNKKQLQRIKTTLDAPQFLGQQSSAMYFQGETLLPLSAQSSLHWQPAAMPFATQVEYALASYIGRQDITLETFSAVVGLSSRSLQRHLQLQQGSFRDIKTHLNVAFSKRVLRQRDVSIADVSMHLGYSDAAQFIRAFKKVTDTTPLQWCKQNRPTANE